MPDAEGGHYSANSSSTDYNQPEGPAPARHPRFRTAGDGRGYQPPANRLYAILHRLREVAVSPILIALDDAHWADPDSLTLLRLMCRRLATLPMALVVTARLWPPELAHAAEELAKEGLVQLERLSPLTAVAAHSVLSQRVGHRADVDEIAAAVASCGGNPLPLAHVAAELEAGHWFVHPDLQLSLRRVDETSV